VVANWPGAVRTLELWTRMALKLTIEYDGTAFVGWQVQPSGPSVQEAVEAAIAALCGVPREVVRVTASGRTDAGVHARGQVISFLPQGHGPKLPLKAWTAGLNDHLPDTVACVQAEQAPDGFDARRWARGKRYVYTLRNHDARSPLWRTRAWEIRRPLDILAMRKAAPLLLGRHDFSAFRAADCPATNPVRELRRLELFADAREPEVWHLTVEATAFLKHMVRNLTGTLVEVGHGKRTPESMTGLLAGLDRTKAGVTAPPHGLVLDQVFYLPGNSNPWENAPAALTLDDAGDAGE
jgi:tRNA pseudouridine38-40 synthase